MNPYHMRHEYSSLLPGCLDEFVRHSNHFIETGTNIGLGIQAALAAGFHSITSIEVDRALYEEMVELYSGSDEVVLFHGSSDAVLAELCKYYTSRKVFYLDAHSIEANPLLQELDAIALSSCKTHTILIDDVRMFDTPDWHMLSRQSAIDALLSINPAYQISYRNTAHAAGDLMVAMI